MQCVDIKLLATYDESCLIFTCYRKHTNPKQVQERVDYISFFYIFVCLKKYNNMKVGLFIPLALQMFSSDAYTFDPSSLTRSFSTTRLFGLKRQRRGLADIAEGGALSSPKKLKTNSATSSGKATSGDISPALAQWAAAGGDTVMTNVEGDEISKASSAEYTLFEDDKKDRRTKQSARLEQDKRTSDAVQQILGELENVLEQKGNGVVSILEQIQKLTKLPSTNLRVMVAGKEQYVYRLAWVGSDDSICHIGTGLHKVPLARLQEIFLTCQGKNRIELFEVISILGPFPNVRNTLQGGSEVNTGDISTWTISMDSMIDGTGKEILAGKEENIRKVKLQIYFADPNAIVAIVPPENGGFRENPWENDGANVLLFVQEDKIDEKLEALRVF